MTKGVKLKRISKNRAAIVGNMKRKGLKLAFDRHLWAGERLRILNRTESQRGGGGEEKKKVFLYILRHNQKKQSRSLTPINPHHTSHIHLSMPEVRKASKPQKVWSLSTVGDVRRYLKGAARKKKHCIQDRRRKTTRSLSRNVLFPPSQLFLRHVKATAEIHFWY